MRLRWKTGRRDRSTDGYSIKSVVENGYGSTKIPFIRGIFNFVDSLVLGMKTLTFSASFFEEEEEELRRS